MVIEIKIGKRWINSYAERSPIKISDAFLKQILKRINNIGAEDNFTCR